MKRSKTHLTTIAVIAFIILSTVQIYSQTVGAAINGTGSAADLSATLDISGTSQGVLVNRMTTAQRNTIVSPAKGLIIYNLDCDNLNCNAGTPSVPNWVFVNGANTFPSSPVAGTHIPSITQITWNWNSVSGASGYKWNTANDYNSAIDMGSSTSKTESDLNCNSPFTRYVWAYNICGNSTSTALTRNTSACPSCGTQVWASANLNVGTMISSNTVPPALAQQQQNNSIIEKYCYNNIDANCSVYGGLYEWNEAMNYTASLNCDPCGSSGRQGLCPTGYHIPTDLEWSRYEYCLENNISPTGTTSLATFQNSQGWRGAIAPGVGPGDKMKVTSSASPTWDGTNTSGFAALPAGSRYYTNGGFSDIGWRVTYWSATELNSTLSYYRDLDSGIGQSFRNSNAKTYGFSVRCIQN